MSESIVGSIIYSLAAECLLVRSPVIADELDAYGAAGQARRLEH